MYGEQILGRGARQMAKILIGLEVLEELRRDSFAARARAEVNNG
jgi:hypothetical protein